MFSPLSSQGLKSQVEEISGLKSRKFMNASLVAVRIISDVFLLLYCISLLDNVAVVISLR